MSDIKTKKTNASVTIFLKSVPDPEKSKDALELMRIFSEVTGEKPAMWGPAIVGFGQYHYKSERSRQEGDWMLTGFSPRKQNLTLYLMMLYIKGSKEFSPLLKELGPAKTSGGCLYIKRLSDVKIPILKKLIRANYLEMKKRYS